MQCLSVLLFKIVLNTLIALKSSMIQQSEHTYTNLVTGILKLFILTENKSLKIYIQIVD